MPSATSRIYSKSSATFVTSRNSAAATGICSTGSVRSTSSRRSSSCARWSACKKLEEDLFSGNLGGLDLEAIREMLGDKPWQDVQELQRIMKMIADSGYVLQQGGQQKLTPKGVRKIGQLALRDIYQGLLRDRPGDHSADRRGRRGDPSRGNAARTRYGDPMNLDLVGTLKKRWRAAPASPLAPRPERLPGLRRRRRRRRTSTVLAPRHELVDELGRPLRGREEGRAWRSRA